MSSRRPGGGPAGPGGPAGNAGARGAILLAVAVILGIVLLQQFDDDTGGVGAVATGTDTSVPSDDEETTTTGRVGLTTVPATTSSTAPARAKGDVKVLVANGSGIRGLAGNTSAALRNLGWATLSPVDATSPQIEKTAIQYAEGYEAEAREIAASLSLPTTVVTPMASPPVAPADLGDAKVVVVLGLDAPTVGSTTTTTRR